jgi:hypothetical protein
VHTHTHMCFDGSSVTTPTFVFIMHQPPVKSQSAFIVVAPHSQRGLRIDASKFSPCGEKKEITSAEIELISLRHIFRVNGISHSAEF